MNIDKELFIFGEPVETEIGLIRFLTYKEYLMNMRYLNLVSMNTLHFYHQFRKMIDPQDKEALDELEDLKETKLLSLAISIPEVTNAYMTVFSLVLNLNEPDVIESNLERIFDSENLFMEVRELVMMMNFLSEDEVSPHPLIQKGIDRSRMVKAQQGERQTPTDIITSLTTGTANSFKEVCSMTVFQVYSNFYRLGAFKSYDTSTLFATVSSDAKIESWAKNIDVFNREESSSIKRSEFEGQTQSLFNK